MGEGWGGREGEREWGGRRGGRDELVGGSGGRKRGRGRRKRGEMERGERWRGREREGVEEGEERVIADSYQTFIYIFR